MKLINKNVLLLLVLFSAIAAFSQDAKKDKKPKKVSGPNFSGTWVLDEARSHDIEVKVFKQKLPAPDPKRKVTNLLVVAHRDTELKLTAKQRIETFDDAGKPEKTEEIVQSELTFYTDKRGEKNKFPGDKTYGSVTTQNGREILVSIIVDEKKRLYNLLVFTLSKDGKELTHNDTGYKVTWDYSTRNDYISPTSMRSKKVYVKTG
jgi:hypothetical protein